MTKILKCSNDVHFENWEVYSTSETKVGTWIDGKPIYQKTYTSSVTANQGVQLGTIANISKVIDIRGTQYTSLGYFPILYYEAPSGYTPSSFHAYYHSTVGLAYGSNYDGTVYITIWYTKTTD